MYIYVVLYSIFSHKKERDLTIYNMDGPRGYNGKWNTSQEDEYRLVSLTQSLKWTRKETNKTPQLLTPESKLVAVGGDTGGRGEGGWNKGIKMYVLLLHNKGVQRWKILHRELEELFGDIWGLYLLDEHWGTELLKSLCCTSETNTTAVNYNFKKRLQSKCFEQW